MHLVPTPKEPAAGAICQLEKEPGMLWLANRGVYAEHEGPDWDVRIVFLIARQVQLTEDFP